VVGRDLLVLGEAVAPGRGGRPPVLLGRSEREAPEVDGRVVVRGLDDPAALLDRFLTVRITAAGTYQVAGVPATVEG
jgi:hypothetical protein